MTLTADELETGAASTGALGDATGKWRLAVSADQPIRVMSLLQSPGGHLTNLSAVPSVDGDVHAVPLFPSMSDALGRQGLVRIVNRTDMIAQVSIASFDDTDQDHERLTLSVGPGEVAHFNSTDLEFGNAEKGLSGSTGAGEGDWRLELTSSATIDVLAYIRTTDGFLTSMHDVVPGPEENYRVAIFNPGHNVDQVSRLRLINAGEEPARVTISGMDDDGRPSRGNVGTTLPPNSARSYTAAELEFGAEGLQGVLGRGTGRWQLTVESDQPVP